MTTQAQKLTIESMFLASSDLSASQYERKDNNGKACALVKILMAEEIDRIEGNVLGEIVRRGTETWVYLSEGTREMRIIPKQQLPLMVRFAEYGIKTVQSKCTYELVVVATNGIDVTPPAAGKGKIRIDYKPAGSNVVLFGRNIGKTPLVTEDLTPGKYDIEISAPGRKHVKQKVDVPADGIMHIRGTLLSEKEINQAAEDDWEKNLISMWNNNKKFGGAKNGKIVTVSVDGIKVNMVKVDGGEIILGTSPKTQRTVTLPPFFISQTEVTQELWQAVMKDNPSQKKGLKKPVHGVTWEDCQNFIFWLNKKMEVKGITFEMATDAQWFYAAKGGNLSKEFVYSGSNRAEDVGWIYENTVDQKALKPYQSTIDSLLDYNNAKGSGFLTRGYVMTKNKKKAQDIIFMHACSIPDVAQLNPNELDIYDMTGGVSEWCMETSTNGNNSKVNGVCYGGSWLTKETDATLIKQESNDNINLAGLRIVINKEWESIDSMKEKLSDNIKEGMKKYGLREINE